MHNLLKRQLKRYLGNDANIPPEFEKFIQAIDNTYKDFDTDRQMLERSLELSSQELLQTYTELRAVFQAIPDLLFRLKYDGTILDFKAGGTNDFLIQPHSLIGRKIQDIPIKTVAEKFAEAINNLRETRTLVSFEYALKVQEQNEFYEARLIPTPDGQMISIIRNITKRKSVQDELEKVRALLTSAIDQSPTGILIADSPNIKIHIANRAALEIIGKTSASIADFELPNPLSNWQIYHPDGITPYPPEQLPLARAIFEGVVSENIEGIIKDSNGDSKWVSVNAGPVLDKDGNITAGIVIFSDITDKKLAEQELIKAKDKAEESNRVKTSFLANMSHELRTPLIGILGYAEILNTELQNSTHLKMIETISNSAKRLSKTLNMILDLSKIESSKLVISLKETEILPIVNKAVESSIPNAKSKGLLLKTSYSDERLYACIDDEMFLEVLSNLLNNAIKYTERGAITVELRTDVIDGSDTLLINIHDTGIGIAEKDMPLIFEEFRQVSEGFGRSFEGTGLGLTITKRMTELMHGRLSVKSRLGKGSTFTIAFPLFRKSSFTPIPERKPVFSGIDSETAKPFIPKVLYVEDDPVSSDIIKLYLQNLCEVELASDGDSALELITHNHFDIILMDINLGRGKDGVWLTKQVRRMAQYANTPIIALTAYAMAGDREAFIEAGCSHYCPKPFTKEYFKTYISSVIEQMLKNF